MTSKEKGRPKKGRLPDLSMRPAKADRYSPPPFDEEYPYVEDFAPGIRLNIRQAFARGRLVDWASISISRRPMAGNMSCVAT